MTSLATPRSVPLEGVRETLNMSQTERTIEGHLVDVTGKAEVAGVEVWFAYDVVPSPLRHGF